MANISHKWICARLRNKCVIMQMANGKFYFFIIFFLRRPTTVPELGNHPDDDAIFDCRVSISRYKFLGLSLGYHARGNTWMKLFWALPATRFIERKEVGICFFVKSNGHGSLGVRHFELTLWISCSAQIWISLALRCVPVCHQTASES